MVAEDEFETEAERAEWLENLGMVWGGYVVLDPQEDAIWGIGSSVESALANALENIPAGCNFDGSNMTLEQSLKYYPVMPATIDLIMDVEERGGAIEWLYENGMACSTNEPPGRLPPHRDIRP